MNSSGLHLWKNRRFARLLVRNFLLWAGVFGALVLSVLLISRWYSVQSVYDQYGEVNQVTLNRHIEDMENDLRNNRHIMLRVAGSDDVTEYFRTEPLFHSAYESYQICMRIHEELMSSCLWDENISSMFLYNEAKDQIISSDYGTVYTANFPDTSWTDAYVRLKNNESVEPFLREESNKYNTRTVLTLMQSVPIIRSQCSGAVVINLDCQAFFNSQFGESIYAVLDQEKHVLCSDGFSDIPFSPEDLPENILGQEGNHLVKLGDRQVLVSAAYSEDYGWWTYSIDLLERYHERVQAFDRILTVLIFAGLLLVLLFSYMLSVRMFVPVRRILYVLEERENEMFLPANESRSVQNEFMLIADAVSHTLDRNKELSSMLEERLQRLNQVRLRMLQGQMNPHFLYNTLASINWMVLEKLPDDNEISDALCTLSELLRDRLKNTGLISLAEEIKQVERYVMLQKLCFADAVETEYDVEDRVTSCAVPSMVVQTLVENAVKHGLDSENGRTLHIRIHAHCDDAHLYLGVRDDGRGIEREELSELRKTLEKDASDPVRSIGLSNVVQQLRLLFGEDMYVHLKGEPLNGFEVEIMIPRVEISDLNPA